MRTRNRYKFTLTAVLLDEVLFSQQVHPQISDLNMKYTKEANQVYYVPSFDSALTFVETEFDLIVSQDIRTKFSLSMVDTYHIFSTKQMSFMRTDCEIDVNHKLVAVTPKLFNPYKKMLDKRDEEYSVADMGLDKHDTYFKIHPLREYYIWQDSKVCVFNDSLLPAYSAAKNMPAHYQDLSQQQLSSQSEEIDMGFKQCWVSGGIGTGAVAGRWASITNTSEQIGVYHHYYLMNKYVNAQPVLYPGDYIISIAYTTVGADIYWYVILLQVNSDATSYVEVTRDPRYWLTNQIVNQRITANFGSYGNFTFQLQPVFSRMVTAITGLSESDDVKAINYDTDIYPLKYKFALRENQYFGAIYSSNNYFFCKYSTRISDTDKGYGKIQEGDDAGKYYDKPDDSGIWQPAYTECWFQGVSVWFYPRALMLENIYYRTVELPDSYKLGDVIKGMLIKINSDIVFEADEHHSQFLFSQINPVTGITQNQKYITQKSNYLNYEYDYPAWKAPLKWSQLEELLKNAFNCYTELFYDESDNAWHLRIEHIKYFTNGHTYDTSESNATVIDLVQAYDGFNREPLSFRTNRWKYDTESQANRYEFGWMDTQSDAFNGSPLVVTDEYNLYEDAKKEDCKVSWFSADIDFMQMVVEECSNDGFVILSCDVHGQVEFNRSSELRYAQNYSLSFDYLIPAFHLCDKYAEYMQIEGTDTLLAIAPRKKMRIAEDIQFKVPENIEIQPSNLVKTEAGFAEIDTVTIDMTDNSCTATLRYETL